MREKRKEESPSGGELLAAGVLGHSLGPFTDGVLAQFSGQVETDGRLDLAAGDRVFLVVVSQSGSLGGDPLEDVVDERVHDAHGLAGDASVGVNLLQNLVDVDGVALLAVLSPLLLARRLGLGGGGFLFAFLGSDLARHDVQYRALVELLKSVEKDRQTG